MPPAQGRGLEGLFMNKIRDLGILLTCADGGGIDQDDGGIGGIDRGVFVDIGGLDLRFCQAEFSASASGCGCDQDFGSIAGVDGGVAVEVAEGEVRST